MVDRLVHLLSVPELSGIGAVAQEKEVVEVEAKKHRKILVAAIVATVGVISHKIMHR